MASKRTKGVRTQWFAMTDTPARKGLYECDSCPALHVWDGENWTIDGEPCRPDSWFIAATKWRGLVRPNEPNSAALAERSLQCGVSPQNWRKR